MANKQTMMKAKINSKSEAGVARRLSQHRIKSLKKEGRVEAQQSGSRTCAMVSAALLGYWVFGLMYRGVGSGSLDGNVIMFLGAFLISFASLPLFFLGLWLAPAKTISKPAESGSPSAVVMNFAVFGAHVLMITLAIVTKFAFVLPPLKGSFGSIWGF